MKSNKFIIVILVLGLFVILGFIFLKYSYKESNSIEDNRIIYKNVSEEQMAEIYYSDFMSTIDISVDEAYKLVNKNEITYNDFLIFVDNLYLESDNESDENSSIKSYKIEKNDNYKLFYVIDNSDRLYIFKEKGIMNYTVFFDETNIS